MNVVMKLEVFLSVEYVWLKECDQFFMAHPVVPVTTTLESLLGVVKKNVNGNTDERLTNVVVSGKYFWFLPNKLNLKGQNVQGVKKKSPP